MICIFNKNKCYKDNEAEIGGNNNKNIYLEQEFIF